MSQRQRHRRRPWISLCVLLGLMIGGLPAGDRCMVASAEASGCHAEVDPREVPLPGGVPADRPCCHSPEATPARPGVPSPGATGAEVLCGTRSPSCCCVAPGSQAVAERSGRAVAARCVALAPSPALPPQGPGVRGPRLAARPSPIAPSKVPLYLRNARLRN